MVASVLMALLLCCLDWGPSRNGITSTFHTVQAQNLYGSDNLSWGQLMHDFGSLYVLHPGSGIHRENSPSNDVLSAKQLEMDRRMQHILKDSFDMNLRNPLWKDDSWQEEPNNDDTASNKNVTQESTHVFIDGPVSMLNALGEIPKGSAMMVSSLHPQATCSYIVQIVKHVDGVTLLLGDYRNPDSLLSVLNLAAAFNMYMHPYGRIISLPGTQQSSSYTEETQFVESLKEFLRAGSVDHPLQHEVHFESPNSIFVQSIHREAYSMGMELAHSHLKSSTKRSIICVSNEASPLVSSATIEDFALLLYGFYKEHLPMGEIFEASKDISTEAVLSVKKWILQQKHLVWQQYQQATDLEKQIRIYLAALKWSQKLGCDVIHVHSDQKYTAWSADVSLAQTLLSSSSDLRPKLESGALSSPVLHYSMADQTSAIDSYFSKLVLEKLQLPLRTHLFSIAAIENLNNSQESSSSDESESEEQKPNIQLLLQTEYPIPFFLEDSLVVWSRIVRRGDSLTCHVGVGDLKISLTKQIRRVLTLHEVPTRDFLNSYLTSQIQLTFAPEENDLRSLIAAKSGICHQANMDVVLSGRVIHFIDEDVIREIQWEKIDQDEQYASEDNNVHDEL